MSREIQFQPWVKQFKEDIWDRCDSIDPDSEYNWKSLTLGWALAKGMTPETAAEFARYIRYNTNWS